MTKETFEAYQTDEVFSAWCKSLGQGQAIVVPAKAEADAEPGECFVNVCDHVAKHGGLIVYGWDLVIHPPMYAEAEFHAVWRSPAGDLLDITPRNDRQDVSYFVIDPARQFDFANPGRIPNQLHALTDDETVHRYLDAFRAYGDAQGDAVGEVVLDMERMKPAMLELGKAGIAMRKRFNQENPLDALSAAKLDELAAEMMVDDTAVEQRRVSKVGRNEPCPCGSGKKHKKCHGA